MIMLKENLYFVLFARSSSVSTIPVSIHFSIDLNTDTGCVFHRYLNSLLIPVSSLLIKSISLHIHIVYNLLGRKLPAHKIFRVPAKSSQDDNQ